MNSRVKSLILNLLVLAAVALATPSTQACVACFGQSDSPMAKGMNAGIFTLLMVIGGVLLGFFVLMIYIVRRGSAYSEAMAKQVEAIRLQNEADTMKTTA